MLVVLNKIDMPAAQDYLPEMTRNLDRAGYRYFTISALTGEGIDPLLVSLDEILRQQEEREDQRRPAGAPKRRHAAARTA